MSTSELQLQLRDFWASQLADIQSVGSDASEFKNQQLPLARIKKIMKSDEDVRMISAEAPVLFAKACEMFILELTMRSWTHSVDNKRRTLQRNDIASAITATEIFDFLADIVPRDGEAPAAQQAAPPPAAAGIAPPRMSPPSTRAAGMPSVGAMPVMPVPVGGYQPYMGMPQPGVASTSGLHPPPRWTLPSSRSSSWTPAW